MPLNPKISDAAANAAADAVVDLLNSGKLQIYDGTQPVTADTAIGAQNLLAELTLNATAFGDASAGVATAGAITPDSDANYTGTAAWFRVLTSTDGKTFDGSVGLANKTITAATEANPTVLTKTTHGLVSGDVVKISGFTGAWVPANGTWRVTYASADTFSIPVNAAAFGAMAGSPVYADADLVLNSLAIQEHAEVSVTAFTYTQPKSA